ncbi:MAG: hypothetical protein HC773_31030, partial [Scytonema sp. CRU_2_7]|nr:hypothetical protein [Scytonema sp. CRU_2_7]
SQSFAARTCHFDPIAIAALKTKTAWLTKPRWILLWSIVSFMALANYSFFTGRFLTRLEHLPTMQAAIAQVHQSGYPNVHLMLPFVRTVEEFRFCRQLVEQAGLKLNPHFQLWIMAEVPSVLFLLPEYIKAGVQGIAIGTNDLTQLLLGVDREQGKFTEVWNQKNPAVMGAIRQLIETARKYKIPCSICGQAPILYPEIIEQLVQWGITSISVEPEAVQRTYAAIARAEKRIILEAARKQSNTD